MSNSETPTNILADLWWSISILIFTVFTTLFIANIIAIGMVIPMFDFSLPALEAFIEKPTAFPQYRMAMMQMQGIVSVFTFIAAPLLFLKYFDKESVAVNIYPTQVTKPILWVLAPFIVIFFMPVDTWIIEWNQSMVLPEGMKGIEQWAKEQEAQMQELTTYMTNFANVVEFLAAIVILAVVPAIGEELLFRGILQNKITLLTKNYHVAIWVSAIVFSAIHFQFYGFVPRVLLGALFGYLYVWSGNLGVAILAHFINNGFTLFLIYAGLSLDAVAPIELCVGATILVIAFLYLFRRQALLKE